MKINGEFNKNNFCKLQAKSLKYMPIVKLNTFRLNNPMSKSVWNWPFRRATLLLLLGELLQPQTPDPRAAETSRGNKNRSSPVILEWMASRRGEKWKVVVMFVFWGRGIRDFPRFSVLPYTKCIYSIWNVLFYWGGMYFDAGLYVMRIEIILIASW